MFAYRTVSSVSVALFLVTSRALAAGDAVKLSGPMVLAEGGDVTSYLVTSDGARVVYRADQDTDEVFELFSAPSDGSAPPIRLNQDLPDMTDVAAFPRILLGAGDLVVYATDIASQPGNDGLFSVQADGSAGPTLLRGLDVGTFALGADGTRVVFTDDDGERLFSVSIDGSSPPIELAPGRTLFATTPGFWVDGAGSVVVFADVGQMLCSVPIDGSAAPLELFTPVHVNESWAIASSVRFASDGVHAYYVEAYDIPQYVDLYWIALDGSQTPIRLTPATNDQTLEFYENAALGRVVYRIADSVNKMIFAVDRDGTDLVELDPLTLNLSGKLRLADDGTTVVFGSNLPSALHRVPIDGSQAAVAIVPGNGQVIGGWELAGSDVVFVRETPVGGGSFSGLYRVPIAGGVEPLLLNGPPVAGQGAVGNDGFVVSPDGARIVFRSFGPSGETLQAVPVDGSTPPSELASMIGGVEDIRFAEGGERVVYRAQRTAGVIELFSAPMDAASAPVSCNAALALSPQGDVQTFLPEFDGQSVVYTADETEVDVIDLYAVPADGSAPPFPLTASLDGLGDVEAVTLARNAKRAVFTYRVIDTGASTTRLYGVRTEPVEAPIELDSGTSDAPLAPLLVAPDGSRVVYRKGSSSDCSLFSRATDGGSPPVALAVPLAGAVGEPQLTPDAATAVFVANLTGTTSLHAIPVDGSSPATLLNAPTPAFTGVSRFLVSPDGSQVVFEADQDVDSVSELYRVPIDGSSAPVKLSASPVSGGDVQGIAISANGQTVVYRGDVVVDGRFELFAVPLSGSEPPVRLTPLPDGRRIENDWIVSDDGEVVFYRADAGTDDVFELWSVRTDGSAPPVKVSGTMIPQGDVASFLVTPDAHHLVFLADKRANDTLELFRRSIGGPVLPVDELSAVADVSAYRLTPDARRVVYLADRDVDGKLELFAARLDGSTPPRRVNADLIEQGDIRVDFVPLSDGSVLYRADQEEDEVIELFHLLRAQTVLPAEAPTGSVSVAR